MTKGFDRDGCLVGCGLALLMAATCGALGCGSDDSNSGGSGNEAGMANVAGAPENSGCPDRLEPVEPIGTSMTVGDGSPTSCTEETLRDAVESLASEEAGGTITFDCGSEPQVITVSEQLEVSGTLMLDGEDRITLSGGNQTRILNLDNYTELTLQRITLSDGQVDDSGAAVNHPWFGTLRAIDVVFQNNHAAQDTGEIGGGAIFAGGLSSAIISGCQFLDNSASNGGGILNRGSTLTIVDCRFEGNSATSSGDGQYGNGGGLYIDGMDYEALGDFHLCGSVFRHNHANQHGSAVFSYFYEGSRSFIDQCLFEENEFDDSPTGGAGGLYHEAIPLYLSNSTFLSNRSDQHAAALFVGSGSSAELTNCTFAHNVVPEVGAAIFSGGSPVTVTNGTFFGNDADYAPAIFNNDNATITVKNTLFANNTTPNQYSALACASTLTDGGGGNFQWPQTRNSGSDDTPCVPDITFADPLLGDPKDNGGMVPTLLPEPGSPAIDAGSDCTDTDATGAPRVGACDSGAVEQRD